MTNISTTVDTEDAGGQTLYVFTPVSSVSPVVRC